MSTRKRLEGRPWLSQRPTAFVFAGVVLVACSTAAAASTSAPVSSTGVVVLLQEGSDPVANAAAHGVRAEDVYTTAVVGYSASTTAAQQRSLLADPAVRMVVPDVRFHGAGSRPRPFRGASSTNAGSNDYLVTRYPQFVPTEVRRIGATRSHTAAIDGKDSTPSVDVAVLDSGIQLDNPELRVTGGVNCSDENSTDRGDYGDVFGHGTEVAGVLAARDNGFGVVGVAPGVRLHSVRVLDSQNGGELSNIVCGVDWVTAHRKQIDIANLSLAGPGSDDGACGLRNRDLLHFAICRSVLAGVVYVAGAGNDAADSGQTVPAAYGEVITASGLADSDGLRGGAGTDCGDGFGDDVFAPFSNFGRDVDVAAVATCAVTDYFDGSLVLDDGTSLSAPAVSGAVALLLERHPHLSPSGVKSVILAARERVHLSGDPDGIDEGVLDVSRF